jgi:general secretion pathway protein G
MTAPSPARLTGAAPRRGGSRRGWGVVVCSLSALVVGAVSVALWGSAGSFNCSRTVTMTKLTMQQIDKYLGMYVGISAPVYPSTAEGLAAAARYLPDGALPKDSWGNDFIYRSNGARYELISLGADGEAGGEGADADLYSTELTS